MAFKAPFLSCFLSSSVLSFWITLSLQYSIVNFSCSTVNVWPSEVSLGAAIVNTSWKKGPEKNSHLSFIYL